MAATLPTHPSAVLNSYTIIVRHRHEQPEQPQGLEK